MQRRELPDGWDADIPSFEADEKGIATRKASNQVQNAIAARLPWLLAGSADLTDSTSVRLDGEAAESTSSPAPATAASSTSGSASTSRRRSPTASRSRSCARSWSTYLTFSDYARPAIRLSALMELPVIHVFTHDSIGLGEDGPTHQPVEQLASLRAIPGLDVIRPADANEVAEAWRAAIDRSHQPVALVLTRQNVPVLDRSTYASAEGLRRGGYVLADAEGGDPEVILIAHRQRGRAGPRCPRGADAARAIALAGRQPALLGAVRPPGRGLPRRGAAAAVHRAGLGRGGLDPGLGPLRRAEGAKIGMHTFGSSAPLKDVQSQVRLHAGEGGRGGRERAAD